MPKRFTETEKWRDSWFRRLPPKLKCLWQYIWDTCDAAGVFDVDFDQASFVIGGKVTPGDLAVFDGRLGKVSGSKFVILEFIPFQYGRLTETCPAHKPVFAAMARQAIAYVYPNDKVTVGIQPSSDTSTIPTRQDKTGQDKSKTGQDGKGESDGKGFPVGLEDARRLCALVAVTPEFVALCYDKAASRGGLDARQVPIEDFPAYVRTEWRYEQDRKGRETAYGPKSNRGGAGENPRNAGIIKGPTDYAAAFKRKAAESAKTQVAGPGAEPASEPPAASGPGGRDL